jgi:hypothetical protein
MLLNMDMHIGMRVDLALHVAGLQNRCDKPPALSKAKRRGWGGGRIFLS